jgi:hypothetical protein
MAVFIYMKVWAVAGPEIDAAAMEKLAQRTMEEAVNRGEFWPTGVVLSSLLGMGLWGAGLVCAIIAVTRRPRRGFAIAALVVSLMPIVFFAVSS